ncbi:hypothetical protein B0F90DRAFT_1109562 [Multifurca ochricompacta]|uniref:Uncharacterized protein n=1 Tax=Multifurca ochricompacta TaxID=376703 RepID=A0AAD4LZU3_9AGAM|nr:hypothetical protein B0F90DRAFT_1109562 [Multifurca ochricompacta]
MTKKRGYIETSSRFKIQSDDNFASETCQNSSRLRNLTSWATSMQINSLFGSCLKLQCIGLAIDKISDGIKAFDFSSSETIQVLHSGNELSQYWENSLDRGSLAYCCSGAMGRTGDDTQKRDMKQVRQAAEHLHRILWNTPFDQWLAAFYVPEFNKSFNYLPANHLSNLRLNDLGFKEMVLLVRQEYDKAFDVIEETLLNCGTSHLGGIIITGQPGIGKTCFLFYLLLRRLSSGQPTAFQIRPTYYLLFKNSGVEVHGPEFSTLPDGTLALVNSNEKVEKPCDGFLYASDKGTTFVVQTTPPKANRWKDWEKYHDGFLYVMECFSWDEMHALGIFTWYLCGSPQE